MAETINTGLGEAISGGTRLSGDWNNSITKGLQINQQNEFAKLQKQQQDELRKQRIAEEIGKFSTIDEGKWYNPENAKAFQDKATKLMAEAIDQYQRGDKVGAYQTKNKITQEMAIDKILDRDTYVLRNMPEKYATSQTLKEVYNKEGVVGLERYNEEVPYAPIATFNPDGSFEPIKIPKVDFGKKVSTRVADKIKDLPKDKLLGTAGGSRAYNVDLSSPEFQEKKQMVINEFIGDADLSSSLRYDKNFQNYVAENAAKNGIAVAELDNLELSDLMRGYLGEMVDKSASSTPRYEKISTKTSVPNSNFYNSDAMKWAKDYSYAPDANRSGFTRVELPKNTTAKPTFEGFTLDASGNQTATKQTLVLEVPSIKYIGNDKFQVNGKRNIDGRLIDSIPIVVDKGQIMQQFGLTEEGLIGKIPSYAQSVKKPAPAKGGATKIQKVNNPIATGGTVR
jgi:hypothetical protein